MAALQSSSRGSRGRGRRTMAEINMVPFIDVMLVLLIIFMVTAPLITPSMIDLVSVGKAPKQPDHVIQVIIGKDESIKLKFNNSTDEKSSTIDQVADAVKASMTANTAVVISADKNVKYEIVVHVMDKLQRTLPEHSRIGLSVQLVP